MFWKKRLSRLVETFEPVLGTTLEIQLAGWDRELLEERKSIALSMIPELENIFSVFIPQSELNRFSATSKEVFSASSALSQVLKAALEWWKNSQGAFHPMAGVLAEVWRDGCDVDEVVSRLREQPYGWSNEAFRKYVDLPINLNAIAKGFIVDELARAMYRTGEVEEVVVNIGGDIRHYGTGGVVVGVSDPRSDAANAEVLSQVHICQAGFATSGRAMRPVMTPNGPVSHVFDPRTGQPVEHWAGVSVISSSAMQADLLATVLMVLPFQEGLEMVSTMEGTEFLGVRPDGEQLFSPGWLSFVR